MPTCTPALVINGTAIRFTNDDKLVNLTDLWKAGGAGEMRRPSRWLEQDQAKDFVSNFRRLNNVAQNDIIHTTRGRFGGTFAHWQIALAYAKYLSPEFHILCNNIIRRFVEEEQNPDMAVDRAISAYRRQGKDDEWRKGANMSLLEITRGRSGDTYANWQIVRRLGETPQLTRETS